MAKSTAIITMWDILKVVEPGICAECPADNENKDCSADDVALVQLMFNGINEKLKEYFRSIRLADFISNTGYECQSKGGTGNEGY